MKNLKIVTTRKEKIKTYIMGFLITYMDYIVWGLFITTVLYKGYC